MIAFVPPHKEELENLARRYAEQYCDGTWWMATMGDPSGAWEQQREALVFLELLEQRLGESRVEEIMSEVEGGWSQAYEELEKAKKEHEKTCDCGYPYSHVTDQPSTHSPDSYDPHHGSIEPEGEALF